MTRTDYDRVGRAIRYLEAHADEQPTLAEVARAAGLSPFHFQRLFRRWVGVSPKRFLQFVTAQHAKEALRRGQSVLETAYDVGLSGPGRLHDLMVNVDAVTPGEVRSAGAGLRIRYGRHATPFGDCVIGLTPRGICLLFFSDGAGEALERLHADWPGADIEKDQAGTEHTVARLFATGRRATEAPTLHLTGTNFQLKVWEALLRVPAGAAVTYGDVAAAIGAPNAARAVGTAVGQNPIAFVIPCHRVLRATGALGGYRWGLERKRAMLVWEGIRR
jgi:AraC family transcriptional regulator of adaptative response/methylated-DNA-[protein]-cysteine methyltransferase